MADFDVFNGDADGLCSLIQLRRAEPRDSEIVTGVKRDIQLLERVSAAAGDRVTALDISMDKNKLALLALLEKGAEVFYCDHHVAGEIPEYEQLDALINTAPDVCTSLLINGRLESAYAHWGIVGAFGDNLDASANALARTTELNEDELAQLRWLGIYLNYNGYGASLDDLHFDPAELYQLAGQFDDPLAFMREDTENFGKLEQGYHDDMQRAEKAEALKENDTCAAYLLPNEKWARRVSGVYGNSLANASPDRAHAVLTDRPDGTYLVSVRAPLSNKTAADQLCMEFPTGGGRKAAAGINALPSDMLDQFLDRLEAIYKN